LGATQYIRTETTAQVEHLAAALSQVGDEGIEPGGADELFSNIDALCLQALVDCRPFSHNYLSPSSTEIHLSTVRR
jgi:hypothetical protein